MCAARMKFMFAAKRAHKLSLESHFAVHLCAALFRNSLRQLAKSRKLFHVVDFFLFSSRFLLALLSAEKIDGSLWPSFSPLAPRLAESSSAKSDMYREICSKRQLVIA
jgi:thiosulfate reductase cytochrome b subunit